MALEIPSSMKDLMKLLDSQAEGEPAPDREAAPPAGLWDLNTPEGAQGYALRMVTDLASLANVACALQVLHLGWAEKVGTPEGDQGWQMIQSCEGALMQSIIKLVTLTGRGEVEIVGEGEEGADPDGA